MNFFQNKKYINFYEVSTFSKKTNFKFSDSLSKIIFGSGTNISSYSTIYFGNTFGNNCFVGHHSLIRENNKIKNNVKIGSYTEVAFNCLIKKNTKIHSHCFICENSKIGENVFIGPNVTFTNSKYPNKKNSKQKLQSPIIHNNVIIGSGSIIMPGVKVGRNAIIGAGSLVIKDVPANKIFYNLRYNS